MPAARLRAASTASPMLPAAGVTPAPAAGTVDGATAGGGLVAGGLVAGGLVAGGLVAGGRAAGTAAAGASSLAPLARLEEQAAATRTTADRISEVFTTGEYESQNPAGANHWRLRNSVTDGCWAALRAMHSSTRSTLPARVLLPPSMSLTTGSKNA